MSSQQLVSKPRVNSAFKQLMSMHWVMAACYLILFTTGSFMARLSRETLMRDELYDFHKTVGVLVMALLSWRILILLQVWWRKYTKKLPKQFTPEWIQKFFVHTLLYLFMFIVPVTGFFLSNSYKSNNVRFLWLTLPDLFPKNPDVVGLGRTIHFWIAYTFLAFIFLHIFHQWKVVRAFWRRFQSFLKTKNLAK